MKKRKQIDGILFTIIENNLYHQVYYDVNSKNREKIYTGIYELLMDELNVKLINIINDFIKSRRAS
jgi:hypothetical protein